MKLKPHPSSVHQVPWTRPQPLASALNLSVCTICKTVALTKLGQQQRDLMAHGRRVGVALHCLLGLCSRRLVCTGMAYSCFSQTPEHREKPYNTLIKLLVIGDKGTGKSDLISCYSDISHCSGDSSLMKNDEKRIDCSNRTIKLGGNTIRFQIWDPAEQQSLSPEHYRAVSGILLVYDITNQLSFDSIRNWITTVDENASETVAKILLGNKCDLRKEKAVKYTKGAKLARELGIPFYETSAKEFKAHELMEEFSLEPQEVLEVECPAGCGTHMKACEVLNHLQDACSERQVD